MISANIRRLCASEGITLAALERKVGIGNGVIARWCGQLGEPEAKGFPRVDILKKVADYFGVTVDDLLKED